MGGESGALASGASQIRALEENLWSLWSRFGLGHGCVLHDEVDATWFDTPIPTLPYNGVIRFTARQDAEHRIDEIFEHYRKRDVPFLWMVHPTATPGLAERLHERGLKEAETCPGMTRLLRDLPPPRQLPPDITLCEVDGETGASALLELVGWRWSVPEEALPRLPEVTRAFAVGTPGSGARSWLAFRDGKPVAKILLNLAGGVAGIYGVATRPEARGLGLARALTLHAFEAAQREGYDLGILHATPMARAMYEKIGFRAQADFRIFAPPGALHL